jgi:hypothetical protein
VIEPERAMPTGTERVADGGEDFTVDAGEVPLVDR